MLVQRLEPAAQSEYGQPPQRCLLASLITAEVGYACRRVAVLGGSFSRWFVCRRAFPRLPLAPFEVFAERRRWPRLARGARIGLAASADFAARGHGCTQKMAALKSMSAAGRQCRRPD